ncbi:MAG: YihY/virulence factor BrkB family protein [Bryobacterales bacterium]|nr:YihY/virulence factor BrkB family protein [Bryobacterales bacterium]
MPRLGLSAKTLAYLLKQTLLSAVDDGCFAAAKGAAYSALLAFFPVLTSIATILVQTRAEFVSGAIAQFLFDVVPPGTEDLVRRPFEMKTARPGLLISIAAALALWAAAGVIKSLMNGFNTTYRVPRSRSFWRESGVAILLVLWTILPLLAASLLIVFGQWIDSGFVGAPAFWWRVLSQTARYLLAFGATVIITAVLYYFGPYRTQRWTYVWRGAVFATVLWLLATGGFAWYVRNLASYNVLYGSLWTGIALLVWMYLIAAIALIGCVFNAEYERMAE